MLLFIPESRTKAGAHTLSWTNIVTQGGRGIPSLQGRLQLTVLYCNRVLQMISTLLFLDIIGVECRDNQVLNICIHIWDMGHH